MPIATVQRLYDETIRRRWKWFFTVVTALICIPILISIRMNYVKHRAEEWTRSIYREAMIGFASSGPNDPISQSGILAKMMVEQSVSGKVTNFDIVNTLVDLDGSVWEVKVRVGRGRKVQTEVISGHGTSYPYYWGK